MKLTGFALLGMGILLFMIGLFLTVGVLVLNIPVIGWFAWIPMGIGGMLIIIGIVLIIIGR